jgi:hypothetical protein
MDKQREAAITHISNEHNVAEEHLKVLVESVASWSTLREEYYQVKVHDSVNQRMYRVLLNGDGNEINRNELHKREEKAYRDKYGKFSPVSRRDLQTLNQILFSMSRFD